MDIVLVHGAGGRPTTWSEVEPLLAAMGHRTVAVTNPLTSLDEDVAHTSAVVEEVIEKAIEKAAGKTEVPLLLVGHSYGGAVITNVGRLLVQGVLQRDYPVVQGAALAIALLFVLVNYAVDMLYMILDPRIRKG